MSKWTGWVNSKELEELEIKIAASNESLKRMTRLNELAIKDYRDGCIRKNEIIKILTYALKNNVGVEEAIKISIAEVGEVE